MISSFIRIAVGIGCRNYLVCELVSQLHACVNKWILYDEDSPYFEEVIC
ncbi:hypothetical protein THOB06_10480 [Vibrio rotiferianus]|nr:hypothetical protein THOG10_10479 [Vibrio rotiferianus]CAH1558114.1 hypothetical protein THOB06_10480 [Vibrio rotiferianus]